MIMTKKKLVFVGGGHANIYALKRATQFLEAGIEVVLIGPSKYHYYSGMGPGMLSGIYQPDQLRFDIQNMIESQGGKFIEGKIVSVDPHNRYIKVDSDSKIDYDLIAFNVGSQVPTEIIPGAEKEAFTVKPIENLLHLRTSILEKISTGNPFNIVLIGGGAEGVEISGNIWRLVNENHGKANINLVNSSDRLLPEFPEKAGWLAQRSLEKRGIQIIPNFKVSSLEDGVALSQDEKHVRYDIAVLSIGIVPSRLFVQSGLETTHDGALPINDYLQSIHYPEIFGSGDCASIQGKNYSKVGVIAVRQGPVLSNNLLARFKNKPLQKFELKRGYGLMVNLGDGTAIFARGTRVWHGRWIFKLKNWIDTSFMKKYKGD